MHQEVLADRLHLMLEAVHRRDEPPDGADQVAALLDVPVAVVEGWLAAAGDQPTASQADRLAARYGVPASLLLDPGDHSTICDDFRLLIQLRDGT